VNVQRRKREIAGSKEVVLLRVGVDLRGEAST
jgi:hypothetical protein